MSKQPVDTEVVQVQQVLEGWPVGWLSWLGGRELLAGAE